MRMIEDSNLGSYFSIIQATPDIFKYYLMADVFVCNSYNESYPRVVLMAMQFELPIITTPVYGIQDQVKDKINALFYETANTEDLSAKLLTLGQDKALREKFSDNSLSVIGMINNHEEMVNLSLIHI